MYSIDLETFSASQTAFRLFFVLGSLHVACSLVTFFTFIRIRLPVIRYMRLRRFAFQIIARVLQTIIDLPS